MQVHAKELREELREDGTRVEKVLAGGRKRRCGAVPAANMEGKNDAEEDGQVRDVILWRLIVDWEEEETTRCAGGLVTPDTDVLLLVSCSASDIFRGRNPFNVR